MEFVRKAGETYAAFKGRERRERADAVDALGLKAGDPIQYAGKFTRFDPKYHVRKDQSYRFIRRLTPEEVTILLVQENARMHRAKLQAEYQEQQNAWLARPDVKAAHSIRFDIENHLEDIIDRLTPAEWIALAEKLDK